MIKKNINKEMKLNVISLDSNVFEKCLRVMTRMFTHVTLVESAPFNVGSKGKYKGVGGHLFAIACKLSWEAGNEGYVQFTSKTDLVDHYITTLGAKHIDSRTLYIDSYNALVLIKKYIKEI